MSIAAGRLTTSNFIFNETLSLCLYRLGHAAAQRVGTALLDPDTIDRIRNTPEDEQAAWTLFRNRSERSYSFTDREPLSRAIFIMFVVAEVHPFDDGNGRIARIMMNAELQAGEQMRVIVPTVCREDYVLALKNLSHNAEPEPLIRFLIRLQRFSHSLNFEDLAAAEAQLRAANAFTDANDAKLDFG